MRKYKTKSEERSLTFDHLRVNSGEIFPVSLRLMELCLALDLLRQIILISDFLDLVQLGLDPIHMLLFIHENMLE